MRFRGANLRQRMHRRLNQSTQSWIQDTRINATFFVNNPEKRKTINDESVLFQRTG